MSPVHQDRFKSSLQIEFQVSYCWMKYQFNPKVFDGNSRSKSKVLSTKQLGRVSSQQWKVSFGDFQVLEVKFKTSSSQIKQFNCKVEFQVLESKSRSKVWSDIKVKPGLKSIKTCTSQVKPQVNHDTSKSSLVQSSIWCQVSGPRSQVNQNKIKSGLSVTIHSILKPMSKCKSKKSQLKFQVLVSNLKFK